MFNVYISIDDNTFLFNGEFANVKVCEKKCTSFLT